MTGKSSPPPPPSVPDYAALIDRAITREMRSNLAAFLTRYEHVEFGRSRQLDVEEVALVLSAVDHFMLDDSFADLGMAEFRDLAHRLGRHAAQEDLFPAEEGVRIRNACFDALVCIKALEARLSRLHYRSAPELVRLCSGQIANDR